MMALSKQVNFDDVFVIRNAYFQLENPLPICHHINHSSEGITEGHFAISIERIISHVSKYT